MGLIGSVHRFVPTGNNGSILKEKTSNSIPRFPMVSPLCQRAETDLRGGKRLDLLGGVNLLFPEWMGMENHVSVEAGAPVYQSLDGPQLKTAWTFFAGWQVVY